MGGARGDAGRPDLSNPADAGGVEESFTGELASTSWTDFGGAPYCDYKVRMEAMTVKMAMDGAAASIEVTNTLMEETVGSCDFNAAPPKSQRYRLSGTLEDLGTQRLEMQGDSTNEPRTALAMELAKSADGYQASLVWTRDDGTAPELHWTLPATIPLSR